MARIVTVGAAQLGPIARTESRAQRRRADDRAAAAGRDPRLRPRRVSGMRAHGVLPALVLRPAGRHRRLLRARDAQRRDAAAVRLRARARHRLLPGLRGAGDRRRRRAPLQHVDPRRQGRPDPRQVPQGPSARPRRARAVASVPEPGEALFRGRQPGLPGVPRVRRHRRHGDLQRPPLARDLPRDGTAGRRDGACWATTRRCTIRPRPSTTTSRTFTTSS